MMINFLIIQYDIKTLRMLLIRCEMLLILSAVLLLVFSGTHGMSSNAKVTKPGNMLGVNTAC